MRLWSLGSGSRGNAVLLESGASRLLIDAGFPARVLQKRLRAIGVAPESIGHCVVTHEHHDHARGAASAAKRWRWALHASRGTLVGSPRTAHAGATAFAAGDVLELDGFSVQTVRTPHDANESVALVATATSCGTRAAICYDLGHASDAVRRAVVDVDVLVVESNHDEGMLRAGPYPPSVCARIAGHYGHLSNRAAGSLARGAMSRRLRHVVLAHLSETCNDAGLAVREMTAVMQRVRYRGAITAASQDAMVGPIDVRGGVGAVVRAEQLALF